MGVSGNKFFNEKGGKLIDDTNTFEADCYGFIVVENAVLSAITLAPGEEQSPNAYTSVTFPAGLQLPVSFTSITLVSGALKALRK